MKEDEAEETVGRRRDRLTLAMAHGPVRVDCLVKVEDAYEEYMDGDGAGEGEGGDGVTGRRRWDWAGRGGWGCWRERRTSRRTTGYAGGHLAGATLRTGRIGRKGGEVTSQPPTTFQTRLRRCGKLEAHKPESLGATACTSTPEGSLGRPPLGSNGVAQLTLPGHTTLELGPFPTADDAARAYDAEVRRRGWVHVRALNFPQPEELAAHAQAEERCDERGLLLSLAPEQQAANHQDSAAAHGASDQRPPKLSLGQKPGKSGFFGVTKTGDKCYKATP